MIWWIKQAKRANTERYSIALLNEEASWLSNIFWDFEDSQLIVRFDITHQNEIFPLKMVYPVAFPETPPIILTIDKKRISGHQYGNGGELCLEYRPDNWHSDITGSMMILSAYKLISGERSLDGEKIEIPDGHNTTIGQEFRSSSCRYLVTPENICFFYKLEPNRPYNAKVRWSFLQKKCTAIIETIENDGENIWSSKSVHTLNSFTSKGLIIYDANGLFSREQQKNEICMAFAKLGLTDYLDHFFSEGNSFHLIFGCKKIWTLMNFYKNDNEWRINYYDTINTPPIKNRLPEEYETLKEKKAGIVGCGSVGSKIATSLARSGVGNFLLVDDDIFFEGNLVRNEFDMESIGFHKVDALKQRILNINPSAEVQVRRVSFGGQESSATTSSVFEGLGKCQIIVDATANDRAFNLNAAVSKKFCIPLIWCSVFAGGIGGTVVRLLPNHDPTPIVAKEQINAWYESNNIPWEGIEEKNYAVQIGDETPMVASDADVSVISSHATRFALDTLIFDGKTKFPFSAYVIGLSDKWIFTAPFDTRPIKLEAGGKWGQDVDETNQEEFKKFFKDMFGGGQNDD